jgi:hypothetical protein
MIGYKKSACFMHVYMHVYRHVTFVFVWAPLYATCMCVNDHHGMLTTGNNGPGVLVCMTLLWV